MEINTTNSIAESTIIPEFVKMGDFNRIGSNVVIQAVKGAKNPKMIIGDCNIINDNVKILVGDNGVVIGDWNVLHNNMLLIGEDSLEIGHNCWFGQNTILDGSGKLFIGNGVRVGMYSQIWTHVASGEQIEGCILYARRPTKIEEEVWLVGSCVVGSGITLARRSTYLINSVITKDSEESRVYSGSPAKLMEKANFYKKMSIRDKFEMLKNWADEFANAENGVNVKSINDEVLVIETEIDVLLFVSQEPSEGLIYKNSTIFNMKNKTFKKINSHLERSFYSYLYNNKARFTPINKIQW
ncbi:hypothetical protein EZ428_05080 [Pedobacter frigiditerrae]|uniref:Uncharacterized protein n=1 Tax=Pedobacter frigiditerrae TaxID=2530452 RepID=A0A4R0N7B7_9SPHI|nr:hypothetical protein [Pedobacter frigiditerrae]TCC94154.1 hypothetical protein EZ428_05080 [Pedobacter frigiditerrae]